MINRLNDAELASALRELSAWVISDDRKAIEKEFVFRDFVHAMGFVTMVALLSEKADHHPEWSNVWNRVGIRLTTHDADGVSARDTMLANSIDGLFSIPASGSGGATTAL